VLPSVDCADSPPGVGAWLFAGATSGAERIAQMLALVSTAVAAGVNPGAYLAAVFAKIAEGWPQSQLDELLPHPWKTLA
jgi:transposase